MRIDYKKRLKNVNLLNNEGFTMLEMLFAFLIFLVIVSFIPLSYQIILKNEQGKARLQQMEWQVFLSQIKKEIRMSDKLEVMEGKIFLERDGQTILYEKYGTNIRRRVDYSGHEIMLQQVAAVKFEPIANGVRVSVSDRYGQNFTSAIRSFIELEGPG